MKRALATLAALLMLAGSARAETRLYAFPWDEPPEALSDTAMAVLEGERTVTLTFAGDCTLGGETGGSAKRFAYTAESQGYGYPLINLRPLFSADDLTLVNLEGVLSDRTLIKTDKEFNFKGKPAYADILALGGVEAVTLANNHALDYGAAGLEDTRAALTAAGLAWCDEAHVLVLDADGVRVGVTASVMGLDRKLFLRQAATLRELGCATIVHVMHMGVEYADTLTAAQVSTARFLAEQGVALVVGHHPHVAQGLAVIDRTTVAYSLGNCVFGGNTDPRDYDACVLSAAFHFLDGALTDTQATVWPIRVSGDTRRNDYQPVLLSGEDAARVMDKMQTTSAFALAPFIPGRGAVQPAVDWR
ncbi:MAG: CapA family protein [Clostridiales bacterium]|nr:CapA family protein [Clostridiales bacterium]